MVDGRHLFVGLFSMFFWLVMPVGVNATSSQQITEQLSMYHFYDVFKDGTTIYALASKPTLSGTSYTDPDGVVFTQTDMYIVKIDQSGDIKSLKFDSARANGAGTLSVNNDIITVFVNFKTTDRTYVMSGMVFQLDKSTLALSNKKILFTNENWGWFPKVKQNGIDHFSFAGYYRILDTSNLGKVRPQTMADEYNAYMSDHSGNIIPVTPVTDTEINNKICEFVQSFDPEVVKLDALRNYRYFYNAAASVADLRSFISTYESNDPDNLLPSARKNLKAAELQEYRNSFTNARSSAELSAFISTYQANDPDKLAPTAKKKLIEAQKREARERKEQAEREARERKERAAREARELQEAKKRWREEEARNAQACTRLYSGKPVSLSYQSTGFFGGKYYHRAKAVIVGVGSGVASARVTGGDMYESDGYGYGTVHEKNCSDF